MASERVDKHPRLRLKPEYHAAGGGMGHHGRQTLRQPVPERFLSSHVAADPCPERDAISLQFHGDVDGALKKLNAAQALVGIGADERRLMLALRIEEVTGTGLNHAGHAVAFEGLPPAGALSSEPR